MPQDNFGSLILGPDEDLPVDTTPNNGGDDTQPQEQVQQGGLMSLIGDPNDTTEEAVITGEEGGGSQEEPVEIRLPDNPGGTPAEQEKTMKSGAYQAFANDLAKKGLIKLEEGEKIESAEDLAEKWNDALNSSLNNTKDEFLDKSLTDKDKVYLGLRKEGLNEDTSKFFSEKISFYNNLNEEALKDDAVATQVMTDYYKSSTKFDDKEIENQIKILSDLGTLSEKAAEVHPKLVEGYQEGLTKVKQDIAAQNEAQQKASTEFVDNLTKATESLEKLGDLPISPTLKQGILDTITKPVGRDKFGNPISSVQAARQKNPVAWEMMLRAYHAAGLFEVDKDGNPAPKFDLFKKQAKSEATSELNDFFQEERTNVGKRETASASDTLKALKGLS